MIKSYRSLGLMSGTSGDGVDASVIQSDGDSKYKVILNKYFKYSQSTYEKIHSLKDKINTSKDLIKLAKPIKSLEKEITLFHANTVNKIKKRLKLNIDLIGFHGQTIFHNEKEKITKQLGKGQLLSKLVKKTVVYNFRKNDLKNGGNGAPLAPIFHKLMSDQNRFKLPVTILNLGGIANITNIKKNNNKDKLYALDIGPGNCLIDMWIRKKTKKRYDSGGLISKSGKINNFALKSGLSKIILKKNNKKIKFTYDVKDFDISFAKGLSLKNGAATLTEYTSIFLSKALMSNKNIIACGGGRKNKFLINCIEKKIKKKIKLIDMFGIDGDFIESQAFAYLAIRSYLKLPISFPNTTGVKKPSTGGIITTY